MERTEACVTCPFRKRFPTKGNALLRTISEYLHMNKGNFACHEDAKVLDYPHARAMRIAEPQRNTCVGYQQMLSGRQPRTFIKKLKEMLGQPSEAACESAREMFK